MPLPSIFFTEPTDDLVLSVADRLTEMDVLEARLMCGADEREAMLQSVRHTQWMEGPCMVCLIDGVPELVCGASRDGMLCDHGQIWMLRTDAVALHRKAFLEQSRIVLASLVRDSGCSYLANWCLAENRRSIRWLQWLGFTFDRDVFFLGHMWRHFYITPEAVNGDHR